MLNYKDLLIQFNGTPKYMAELDFLFKLISPKKKEKIIDYGCGLGTAMKHIHFNSDADVYGFDITKEYYLWDSFWFRMEMFFKVDTIYFMHSIAHINKPPLARLKNEFLNEGGKLIIITPNAKWMDAGYKKDPTVIKHYDLDSLSELVTNAGFRITHIGQFGEIKNGHNERLFLIAK